MRTIAELCGRHENEAAWLFGKGPSLDSFDFNLAGVVRICVNESVIVVPNPTYFFAHDEGPIAAAADSWPSGCCAVLQAPRAAYARRRGIPKSSIFTYEKRQRDDNVLSLERASMAEQAVLYGSLGTAHSAMHFCRLIGVREVRLVGFDGRGGYASCLQLASGGANHARIREELNQLCQRLEMQYTFFDATPKTLPVAVQGGANARNPTTTFSNHE